MRKRILILTVLVGFLLALPVIGFAAVGLKHDTTSKGQIHDIIATGPATDGVNVTGGTWTIPIVDKNLFAMGAGTSGATSMTTSDLTVPNGYNYVRKALAADAAYSAGILPNGKPGELKTIHITEDLGSITYTVTPDTSTGFASIGFDAVGEVATLLYVDDTTGWVLAASTNATVNVP